MSEAKKRPRPIIIGVTGDQVVGRHLFPVRSLINCMVIL